jgi:hypothetical protein
MRIARIMHRIAFSMTRARCLLTFPRDTLFFCMDGVLFAHMPEERWCAIDDSGHLLGLSRAYAAEIGRMLRHAEMIVDEDQFRAGLANDAVMPPDVDA